MRRRKLFVALALALVATAIAVPVYAAHTPEGTVTATVSLAQISIGVDPTSVAYGPLDLESTGNFPSPTSFVVTNNGDVTEDFIVRGQNSANWTLGPDAGTNIYKHEVSTNAFGGGEDFVLDTSGVAVASNIATNGTVTMSLRLDMPLVTAFTGVQEVDVTIVATASP